MDEQLDTANELDAGSGERVDVSDRGRRRRWQIGVLACLVGIAALVVGLRFVGDDGSATGGTLVSGQLSCGDGNGSFMGISITGDGNGAATPGLALWAAATAYPQLGLEVSDWASEGPTPDPSDQSLVYVKRDGAAVVGAITVSPVGSGWTVSSAHSCE